MDLSVAWQELRTRVDRVDFSRLWRGFQPTKFAVYNDTECFLMALTSKKNGCFPGEHRHTLQRRTHRYLVSSRSAQRLGPTQRVNNPRNVSCFPKRIR